MGLDDGPPGRDRTLDLRSIAVPPLGCGNGGLAWADVRPLIESSLDGLNGVEVVVYPPEGTSAHLAAAGENETQAGSLP